MVEELALQVGAATGTDTPPDVISASRRGLMAGTGLAAIGALAGGLVAGRAYAQASPAAAPTGAAVKPAGFEFPGKVKGLSLLGDRPLVVETPEDLLDDDTTPIEKFFIRNNGQMPEIPGDVDAWKLKLDGEVATPLDLTLGELKRRFPQATYRMVLECGGNGRSGFQPQARGNPWSNGGVGCAEWTGVPLADVLKAAGPKPNAKYTAHHGSDPHLSGDATKETLSRGMPIEKALDPHCLLVFAMNGQPLPAIHGGPLRLIIPGWPGSLSHKWLNRITVRDREHDGQGMTGTAYRVPRTPMVPGGKVDEANFKILESMPVRSIVTSPRNGTRLPAGTREVALRGAAWAGDLTVSRVDVSADGGRSWTQASLAQPKNRYDWQRWTAKLTLPSSGYFEIWTRATDSEGHAQPHVATNWNPQGYGGNAMHRVAILVA